MLLNTTTTAQKRLITNDVLHKYIKHPNFWLVVDNKNKPKGLFKTFLEAYHKKEKVIIILVKDIELSKKRKSTMVNAICHCGNTFIARKYDILKGHTKSCGCTKGCKTML